MRPQLPRGQAPAKGILHTEQRSPARIGTNALGTAFFDGADPRGYWLGQHKNPKRAAQRDWTKLVGRRLAVKYRKANRALGKATNRG